jgi:hypothetical protein
LISHVLAPEPRIDGVTARTAGISDCPPCSRSAAADQEQKPSQRKYSTRHHATAHQSSTVTPDPYGGLVNGWLKEFALKPQ